MSKRAKVAKDEAIDPEVWAIYEKLWKQYDAYHNAGMLGGIDGIVTECELIVAEQMLEALRAKIPELYLPGDAPPRITMKDVIAYHAMLDKKYGLQSGAK